MFWIFFLVNKIERIEKEMLDIIDWMRACIKGESGGHRLQEALFDAVGSVSVAVLDVGAVGSISVAAFASSETGVAGGTCFANRP